MAVFQFFCVMKSGIVVSTLSWHLLGSGDRSCPGTE